MKLIDFKKAVLTFLGDSRVNSDSSVFNSTINIMAKSPVENQQEVARVAVSSKTERIYLIVGCGKEGDFIKTLRKIFGNHLPIPIENVPMSELQALCNKKSKYDYYDIFIAWFHIYNDKDTFDYVEADRFVDDDYKPGNGLTWLCFLEDRDKKSQKNKSDKLDENENKVGDFRPSEEWMAQKYDEMNQKLFDGRLGKCHFGIFKNGKGSQGNTLGYFTMDRRGLKMMGDGSMFVENPNGAISLYAGSSWNPSHTWIDHENFYDECNPTIKLNGNYSGNEENFLMTLVHEMCHYFNYMSGKAPRQAHGPEFRSIAARVQIKSGGEIKVERLASAELVGGLKLDADILAKREKRVENMMKGAMAIVVFEKDGTIKLTLTKSRELMRKIVDTSRERDYVQKIAVTVNKEVNDFLIERGYGKLMRSWRFWRINKTPWINEFIDIIPPETYVYSGKFDESLVEISEDDDEGIAIPAGMNLGLESPFEI